MGSPCQFDGFAECVHRRGISAASLLLPGHGDSAKEFGTGTMERWQAHVNSEIERYSQYYNDIWLVGHSMGGLLAINASVSYKDHVRGIFMMMTPFKVVLFSPNGAKVRIKQGVYRKSHPIKAAYLEGSGVRLTLDIIWRALRPTAELFKLIRLTKEILPDVSVPVTAVYAIGDELTSLKSLGILRSGLRDVPFEHVILPDSLHAYFSGYDRAVMEQALLKFVFG